MIHRIFMVKPSTAFGLDMRNMKNMREMEEGSLMSFMFLMSKLPFWQSN
jgi:hypothetical protein